MQLILRPGVRRPLVAVAAVLSLLLTGAAAAAGPDESKSATLARELAQVLDVAKLDAMAAVDPGVPGGFVAVIYIPETQLLVVSARYAAPSLLVDKIKAGDFRGVYMDLHAAGMPGSRIFVQDMGPDGLLSKADNGDSWEEGGKTTTFDGQWRKTKLTETEYEKLFADADGRYAKMLALLVAQTRLVTGKGGS